MLKEFSIELVFHFMLIFSRLAAAFNLFPIFGDRSIFARGRLAFSLSVSVILYPAISGYLPKYSEYFSLNVSIIVIEILIGLVISIGARFYFLSLNAVSHVISMQSGLGSATFFDPNQRSQVAIFGGFLFILANMYILANDIHYLFIDAVIESYKTFPPGEWLAIADVSKFITKLVNNSFILSFKLASPFLIISFVMLVGGGVLSRLMPNLQVFFVITPAQILVMFGTLYVIVNSLIAKVVDSMSQLLTTGVS